MRVTNLYFTLFTSILRRNTNFLRGGGDGWRGLRLVGTESNKLEYGGETKKMHATFDHLVVFLLELCFVLLTLSQVSVWTPRLSFVSQAL